MEVVFGPWKCWWTSTTLPPYSLRVSVCVFSIITFQAPYSPSLTLALTLCHWTWPEPHTPFGSNIWGPWSVGHCRWLTCVGGPCWREYEGKVKRVQSENENSTSIFPYISGKWGRGETPKIADPRRSLSTEHAGLSLHMQYPLHCRRFQCIYWYCVEIPPHYFRFIYSQFSSPHSPLLTPLRQYQCSFVFTWLPILSSLRALLRPKFPWHLFEAVVKSTEGTFHKKINVMKFTSGPENRN